MANESKIIQIDVEFKDSLNRIAQLSDAITELSNKERKASETAVEYKNRIADQTTTIKMHRQEIALLSREVANKWKVDQQELGHIEKLKAEVSNLTLTYERLNKTQLEGAKGTQVLNDLKGKREELAKLNQAYGNYGLNVGNYSSATKMLGINLGQVMKEMPNFAISARIGIMSLTNNLPMLAESIKAVRLEQKQMIESQKAMTAAQIAALPNMGKIPSMWKMIGASIFGLTGIMSIAMVLFQIFGPEIWEWAKGLFVAKEAVEDTTTAIGAMNKVMKDGGGAAKSTIEHITKLGIEITKFGDNSKYSKGIIEDFNKTFDTHLTTIDEVRIAYPKMATAAIDAAIKVAASNDLIEESSKQLVRGMKAESILSQYSPQQLKETENRLDNFFNAFRSKLKSQGFGEKEIIEKVNNMADAIKNGELKGFWVEAGWNGFDKKLKDARLEARRLKEDPKFASFFDAFGSKAGEAMFKNMLISRASKVQQSKLKNTLLELSQPPKSDNDKTPNGRTAQESLYKEASIKEFDFKKLMDEATAKMLQDGVERDMQLLDNELRDRSKRVEDYIIDLKAKKKALEGEMARSTDPKNKAAMQADIAKYGVAITESETGQKDFASKQIAERETRKQDIIDKWHAKNLSALSQQRAAELQLQLDAHNTSIDEETAFQAEIAKIKNDASIQSENDTIKQLKKQLSDVKDINSVEYKDIQNLITQHEAVKTQIVAKGADEQIDITTSGAEKKLAYTQAMFRAELDDTRWTNIQKLELKLKEQEDTLKETKNTTEAEKLIYAKLKGDIAKTQEEIAQQKFQDIGKYVNQFMSGISTIMSDINSVETDNLQTEKNKQLAIAGNNAQQRETIEKDFAQKELDLRKKQANAAMGISIAQAVATGALGIAEIWAKHSGIPFVGIPMAVALTALLGGVTMANIGAAIAQRNAIASQTLDGSSGSSSSTTKTTVTEKFHTGGNAGSTADSYDKSQEVTATLLKGERILSNQQTGVFNSILGNIQSLGGSKQITSGIGGNINQTEMLEMAVSRAMSKMPPPVVIWKDYKDFNSKMATFEQNKQL